MKKTIAELIDELTIVNIKIFWLVDKVQKDKFTKKDAKKIQNLNALRSRLKNAILEEYNLSLEVKV